MTSRLFNTLDSKLQGRNRDSRKIANNTYLRRYPTATDPAPDAFGIELHGHRIIGVDSSGRITVDLCGWNTPTTRTRVNHFFSDHRDDIGAQYRLDIERGTAYLARYDLAARRTCRERVYRYTMPDGSTVEGAHGRNYHSYDASRTDGPLYMRSVSRKYLRTDTRELPPGGFARIAEMPANGPIYIGPRGGVTGGAGKRESSESAQLRKRIRIYAKLCAEALPIETPSGGNCWYCAMFDGPATRGKLPENLSTAHILAHMEEGYVVPSLVLNALAYAGCTPDGSGGAYVTAAFDPSGEWLSVIGRDQMARFIRRYIGRCLSL